MAWQLKRRNHLLLPLAVSLGSIDYRREAMSKLAARFATDGTEVTLYGRGTGDTSPRKPISLGIREYMVVTKRQSEPTGEAMRGSGVSLMVMKLGELANGGFSENDRSTLHFEPLEQLHTSTQLDQQ